MKLKLYFSSTAWSSRRSFLWTKHVFLLYTCLLVVGTVFSNSLFTATYNKDYIINLEGNRNPSNLLSFPVGTTANDIEKAPGNKDLNNGAARCELDFTFTITNASCRVKGSMSVIVTNATPYHTLHIWGDNNVDKQYTITSNVFQVTDIQAGTYSMRIVDANKCEKTKSFTVVNSVMDFGLEITNASCSEKGSMWVTVTDATSNLTLYIWGDNNIDKQYTITSNVFQVTDIKAGTYSMRLIDAHGCERSKTFTVTGDDNIPTVGLKAQSSTCASPGLIAVTIIGGLPTYTISWTGPSSGTKYTTANKEEIPNLQAGIYTVTITDSKRCSTSKVVTINKEEIQIGAPCDDGNPNTTNDRRQADCSCKGVPAAINMSLSVAFTCNNLGSIEVQIRGGIPTYTVSWSGPTTNHAYINEDNYTITGLQAGVYNIAVTDSKGIFTREQIRVEGNSSNNLSMALYPSVGKCGLAGLINVDISNGVGECTISWSGTSRGTATTDEGLYEISDLAAGTYTVTIRDESGCTDRKNTRLDKPQENLRIRNPIINQLNCKELATIGITGIEGKAPYTISWEGSTRDSIVTAENWYNIEELTAGKYMITVEDNNGCFLEREEEIFNETLYFCLRETSSRTVNTQDIRIDVRRGQPPYNVHIWNGNGFDQTYNRTVSSFMTSNLAAGMYHFEITDNQGCSQKQTLNVGSASNTIYATICEGDFYSFGERTYTQSGTHTLSGCVDSNIRYLVLTVENCATSGQYDKKGEQARTQHSVLSTTAEKIFNNNLLSSTDRQHSIRLYPNPTNDFVTIQFQDLPSKLLSLSILSITGQEVYQYVPTVEEEQIEVVVADFPMGTYLVRLIDENGGVTVEKLLIN